MTVEAPIPPSEAWTEYVRPIAERICAENHGSDNDNWAAAEMQLRHQICLDLGIVNNLHGTDINKVHSDYLLSLWLEWKGSAHENAPDINCPEIYFD